MQSTFEDFLTEKEILSESTCTRLHEAMLETNQGLAASLSGLGLLSENDIAHHMADFYNLEVASIDDWKLSQPDLIKDVNPVFLKNFHIAPIYLESGNIVAVSADPSNTYAKEALEFSTSKSIVLKVAPLRELETFLNDTYFGGNHLFDETADQQSIDDDVNRLKELATDAPVIRFVDRLIDDSLSKGASDIHIEPINGLLSIRLRIDGVLVELPKPSRDMTAAIISRVKIMSGIDIAERRLAQDGRMRVRAHGKEVDFRVSTSPTNQGEAIVLRLLDRGAVELKFANLGFDNHIKELFLKALNAPDGIILVTGPTGSGKTTTLYTGLSELNTPERKILTVEDPVEYVMDGIGQVQVDSRIGRTFANTLRSFLRQDPDVIMVGEIRDNETAGIAIQASLTGHLVLSTVHTNSASATISRMLDMGVEDYLLSSTVKIIIAQRLVRKLCASCKTIDDGTYAFLTASSLQKKEDVIYKPRGCPTCNYTGYKGRRMIAEVLAMSPIIEKAIIERKTASDINTIARESGMRTLFEHGLEAVKTGETSMSEILRVTREVEV